MPSKFINPAACSTIQQDKEIRKIEHGNVTVKCAINWKYCPFFNFFYLLIKYPILVAELLQGRYHEQPPHKVCVRLTIWNTHYNSNPRPSRWKANALTTLYRRSPIFHTITAILVTSLVCRMHHICSQNIDVDCCVYQLKTL